MKEKTRFFLRRLLPAIISLILLAIYIPSSFDQGIYSAGLFFKKARDDHYSSRNAVVLAEDNVLTISDIHGGDLSPLTVAQDGDIYTIQRESEIIYQGKYPDTSHDRLIRQDGTLTDTGSKDKQAVYYPLTLTGVIDIYSRNLTTRGLSREYLLALLLLAVWSIDVLFPDLFYRLDPRGLEKKGPPSRLYRRMQTYLRIICAACGIVFIWLACW